MSTFGEKTASGVVWSVAGQAGRQSAVIVCNVVLARLLTPDQFGLTASVLIFANFAVVVAEQGFSAALIQRQKVEERHLSSIFWVNVLAGALMSALFLAGAPLVARTFGQPELTPLSRAIASLFLINSFGVVHYTMLTRELEFKRVARSETIAAWVGGLAAIAAAWAGAGAWAIVAQSLATAAAGSVVVWRICPWRPKALFDVSAVRDLLGFSTNFFLSSSATYWVRNVDNLLVGAFLGPHQLGLYTRAYAVMLFPLNRIARVLSRVMLPSLSIIQEERGRVRSVFLRMTRVVAMATFPLMLVVAACAEDFVGTIFGANWGEMVPVLRVLAWVGLVQSVSVLQASLFYSQDQTGLRLRVQLPLHALEIAGIVFGLRYGIMGVALGYGAACMVTAPLGILYAGRLVGLGLFEFAANLSGIFACAAAAAAAAAACAAALPADWAAPARFVLEAAAAGAVYVGLLKGFSVAGWEDLSAQVRRSLKRRAEGASA